MLEGRFKKRFQNDLFFCGNKKSRILWMWPPPSNSHHQEYYIFNRESQPKPSFATVTGRGPHPKNTIIRDLPQVSRSPGSQVRSTFEVLEHAVSGYWRMQAFVKLTLGFRAVLWSRQGLFVWRRGLPMILWLLTSYFWSQSILETTK